MFKQLKNYYVFVSLPFVLLLVGAAIFIDGIKYTLLRNPHPQINYTIFTIILIGGVLIILNTRRLLREARTIVDFFKALHAKTDSSTLQKMANSYKGETSCLLQMVVSSEGRAISHQEQVAIEHEMTNTRASLLRRNALPQYLTGLLVGMGLLGTFIGLLATLNDITVLISSFADLDMQNASPLLVFRTMIERMKAPMQSMGIAFSASMFGLLGSIILGLMMVGLRRLQGDMFSVLSSEIARHIEIALSRESVAAGSNLGNSAENGAAAKVLIRIEERYAEAARSQQRALSSLIDDIQKQRTDMLRALTEQTEANNSFRGELQLLGRQLGGISNVMERGNDQLSTQVSELTIHLSADAKESHKLLAMQVDEQKSLKGALDSYKIEERLAEAARSQQRALSSVINDFQQQRAEMLVALTEQTEANNNSRGELKQLGGQLSSIFDVIETGNSEISTQLIELTVHVAADAKEANLLLNTASSNLSTELQQLGNQISGVLEQGNEKLSNRISEQMRQMAAASRESNELLDNTGNKLSSELQQLGGQLDTAIGKGGKEISGRISELMEQVVVAAKQSNELFDNASNKLSGELQQLGGQLGTVICKGDAEISSRISELMVQMAANADGSIELVGSASNDFCMELQQLGSQISSVMEQGNGEICTRISELVAHMAAARESDELVALPGDEELGQERPSVGEHK